MVFPQAQQPPGVYVVDKRINSYFGSSPTPQSTSAATNLPTNVIVSDNGPTPSNNATGFKLRSESLIPRYKQSPICKNGTSGHDSSLSHYDISRSTYFKNTLDSNKSSIGRYPLNVATNGHSSKCFSDSLPDEVKDIQRTHPCPYSDPKARSKGKTANEAHSHLVDQSNCINPMTVPMEMVQSNSVPTSGCESRKPSSGISSMESPSKFSAYMPLCEVQRRMKKGQVIEGILRINPKNFEDSFISAPGGLLDIYISGMKDRNRAFNGDLVAVEIKPCHEWRYRDPAKYNITQAYESSCSDHLSKLQIQDIVKQKIADMVTKALIDSFLETHNSKPSLQDPHPSRLNQPLMTPIADDNYLASSNANEKKKIRKRRGKNKKKTLAACLADDIDVEESEENGPGLAESNIENLQLAVERVSLNLKPDDPANEADCELLIKKICDILRREKILDRVQITGRVINIVEERHSRLAGGKMKLYNESWAIFSPSDSRIPRMLIPIDQCPSEFMLHPDHFAGTLFGAKFVEWPETESISIGELVSHLGEVGNIEAESKMILMENEIDTSDFPQSAYIGLPLQELDDSSKWSIPEQERIRRRDFTKECVFTIDPKTARDLDDALSVRQIGPNLYKVGVHIADVSYFVREGMPLDEIARKRSTSTYLVQRVIPMLPRILCEKLCSLNPGEDKLTFSVEWLINEDGEILEEWFGKSIINSCIKLSYELAQDMIDFPNRQWKAEELPIIFGAWNYSQISTSVNILFKLSKKLRARRFENGALKIDKIKLAFDLDGETGLPKGFAPYTLRQSNKLVEELMLLANISVAHKIYKAYPDLALLRRHPEPDERSLREFQTWCEINNMLVDTSSSGAIMQSLNTILSEHEGGATVATLLLLKSMTLAGYFCAGTLEGDMKHYALSVPLYTHFTSPIRRYPDVIVHRMLDAALRNIVHPVQDSAELLNKLSDHCNDMKYRARQVSDSSMNLFLHVYYRTVGTIRESAVVYQILDRSLDVILDSSGNVVRIPMDYMNSIVEHYKQLSPENGLPYMEVYWKSRLYDEDMTYEASGPSIDILRVCDRIEVQVSTHPADFHKLVATLIHPSGEVPNISEVFSKDVLAKFKNSNASDSKSPKKPNKKSKKSPALKVVRLLPQQSQSGKKKKKKKSAK